MHHTVSEVVQSLGEANWLENNGRMILLSAPDVQHVTEERAIPGHEGRRGYFESRSSVQEIKIL